jgi:hypothetical protein
MKPKPSENLLNNKFDETFVYENVQKNWHPTLNLNLSLSDFIKTSTENAYFLCKNCHHSCYDEIYLDEESNRELKNDFN